MPGRPRQIDLLAAGAVQSLLRQGMKRRIAQGGIEPFSRADDAVKDSRRLALPTQAQRPRQRRIHIDNLLRPA